MTSDANPPHPVAARKGRRLFDDGDAPYHLKMMATEAFPTGVIRMIYSPAKAPAKVGYDEVKDQVPGGKQPPSEADRRNGTTSVGRRCDRPITPHPGAICGHAPHVTAAQYSLPATAGSEPASGPTGSCRPGGATTTSSGHWHAAMRCPVQRFGVRITGQSVRGHAHCGYGCGAARNRRYVRKISYLALSGCNSM
jgi:hypothetical protein